MPYAVTVFADTLFSSSGLFNTALFVLTRPNLMPRNPNPVYRPQSTPLVPRSTSVGMMMMEHYLSGDPGAGPSSASDLDSATHLDRANLPYASTHPLSRSAGWQC